MIDWLTDAYRNCDLSFVIEKAEPIVLRAPVETPVQTSFGTMHDRPALFLQLQDSGGSTGTGEIWCNFPTCGAEHRAALLNTAILPALVGREFSDPASCFDALQSQFQRLAIQSGEFGPFAQCLAGIDVALWDLVAQRIGVPLFQLFGGSDPAIKTYASGINPTEAARTVARCRNEGHTAFKLKIGFGDVTDFANLDAISTQLQSNDALMVDANQAWQFDDAVQHVADLARYPLKWLEEPMLATAADDDWRRLAESSSIPLAGGENLADENAFISAIEADGLDVIQPDLCKWGGFSGTLVVAKRILASGKRYCPHFLGAGVGLMASAHLLAAVGGDGCLEIDANPNPLREQLFSPVIENGIAMVTDEPGLGIDPAALSDLQTQFRARAN